MKNRLREQARSHRGFADVCRDVFGVTRQRSYVILAPFAKDDPDP
jgi:hypothetical protein